MDVNATYRIIFIVALHTPQAFVVVAVVETITWNNRTTDFPLTQVKVW
jgi:hypothetical protein